MKVNRSIPAGPKLPEPVGPGRLIRLNLPRYGNDAALLQFVPKGTTDPAKVMTLCFAELPDDKMDKFIK